MKLRKMGLALSLTAAVLAGSCLDAKAYYTEPKSSSTYIYGEFGWPMGSPDAYEYSRTVDLRSVGDYQPTNLTEMCVTDENVYLVDTAAVGVILRFDRSMNYIDSLQTFTMPDGSTTQLSSPEGLYVAPDGRLYIADTGNSRVLVSDWKGNVSLEVLKPENLVGTKLETFLPIKVVADSAGRISVVARNINSGIMQFTSEGFFTGYIGAPSVSVDPFSKFMRKYFYTDAQRAATTTYVPTEYNNIKIDGNNFIWGTISALSADDLIKAINSGDGSTTPIKKLNMKGGDVLVRHGLFPPVGDLVWTSSPSRIVDVGLGTNNIYSLLDSNMGRIFTYNNSGILLYAFGGKGTAKGETQLPVALDYVGNNMLLLDNGLSCVFIYEPTVYGQLLIDAEGYYQEGEYDAANECWRQVTELNSNFAYPYIGLGDAEYNNGNYEEAMAYYQYANDRSSYSDAKEKIRKSNMEVAFPYIVGAVILLALLFVGKGIFIRARRYVRGEMMTYGGGGDEE